ncbi:MAG: tetratricopeptide repeat protein [Pyrinomonadaceae bacterium]
MQTKFLYNAIVLTSFLCVFQVNIFAQNATENTKQEQVSTVSTKIRNTATKPKIFIAPTQDGFGNFISAALLENKVPVQITASEEAADYIIVSSSAKGQNKWYDTVFGTEKDRNQGSIKVIRVSDKTVVWASASGDKSFWFSEFKSMGQSKVANRLARKLKGDLPKILLADEGKTTATTQDKKAQVAEILGQETPESIKAASGAIKPTLNAEGYNQNGVGLFQQNKYAEAETAFREAVRLEPYNAAYHHNLGTALNAQSKLDEAEKEIELATRLSPNEETYKKGLEVVRANKNSRIMIRSN